MSLSWVPKLSLDELCSCGADAEVEANSIRGPKCSDCYDDYCKQLALDCYLEEL
jgi:hypothetical protein